MPSLERYEVSVVSAMRCRYSSQFSPQASQKAPWGSPVITLRQRQNCHHFADVPFKRIFLNETQRISIKISLNFVPKGPINNIAALVQIMARRRRGDKPLSEPMMASLLTHICVTRPQWVMWDMGCLLWVLILNSYSASITDVMYAISCYIGPRLNSSRLHFGRKLTMLQQHWTVLRFFSFRYKLP